MAYAVGPYTTAAGVPGEVHATQLNPVGAECQFVTTDDELGTYIYLPGVASTVAGSWVTFPSPTGLAACTTVLLTVTATGPVAIATGRVCLGVSAGAGNFIFGAWSYSAQPDSDSAATGTPGADKIVVYVNFPFASKNY
jgi:hypothetical protein